MVYICKRNKLLSLTSCGYDFRLIPYTSICKNEKKTKKTIKAKILGLFKAAFLRYDRNVSGFLSRKAVLEYLKEGKQKEDKKEK